MSIAINQRAKQKYSQQQNRLSRQSSSGVCRDEVEANLWVPRHPRVITHSGSVVVLPVFDDGRILMIRQYRHAARQYLWELVAGRIDRGETVKHAAARELKEEDRLPRR